MRVYTEAIVSQILRTKNAYFMSTGKIPTHLELSPVEYSQLKDEIWDMVAWFYEFNRQNFEEYLTKHSNKSFDGMIIVVKE